MTEPVAAPREPLDDPGARQLVERTYALLNEHDPGKLDLIFAADVVFQDDAWPRIIRGLEELRPFFQWVWRAVPDATWELIDGPYLSEDGRGLAVHSRISGRMRGPLDPPGLAATNSPLEVEYGGFFEIDAGLIKRGRVIINMQSIAVQIGAAPPTGSRGERAAIWLQRLGARRMRRRAEP